MAKQKPDLPQGTLDLLVLKALSLGPMHGYGVGQRIQQLAEDMLQIEEGTLYPAPLPQRTEWLDRERVGHLGEQPTRAVLQADALRPQAALGRGVAVGAPYGGRR